MCLNGDWNWRGSGRVPGGQVVTQRVCVVAAASRSARVLGATFEPNMCIYIFRLASRHLPFAICHSPYASLVSQLVWDRKKHWKHPRNPAPANLLPNPPIGSMLTGSIYESLFRPFWAFLSPRFFVSSGFHAKSLKITKEISVGRFQLIWNSFWLLLFTFVLSRWVFFRLNRDYHRMGSFLFNRKQISAT